VVARLKGNGSKETVGVQPERWPVDPFGALVKDVLICGRGTTDSKDCVAAGLMLIL
jgi:acetylornithine deacetylase/succinyl-diaminopimelate desuccinylase-like protein